MSLRWSSLQKALNIFSFSKSMKLKEFLDKYGTNTTSSFQLLHWGKQLKLKNFHITMEDEIKGIDKSKPIINLTTNIQNSDEPMVRIGVPFTRELNLQLLIKLSSISGMIVMVVLLTKRLLRSLDKEAL